ncbi:MAG: hypothetical protein ACX94C_09400 [Phycisphaerales bacterium]
MHTDQHLSEALLDPNLSAPAICRAHNITLSQLVEFLEGPDFQQLTEATRLLSESRMKLIALDIAPRAMQALDQSTETTEESRLLNETIRKSATRLLAIARQSTTNTHHPQQARADSVNPTNEPHTVYAHEPASAHELASDQAALASSPGHPGEVSARADGGGLHSNQPRSHRPNPIRASSPDHPWDVSPRSDSACNLPTSSIESIIARAGTTKSATSTDPPAHCSAPCQPSAAG